jgi:ribosomal protein S18 acetylase RimI-like enzyme
MKSQPKPPAIRIATPADAEPVVDALVLAFSADPVTRYAFPQPTQHRVGFGAFVLAFGGAALARGTAFAAEDFRGIALWLPPGAEPDEAAVAAIFERSVPRERLDTMYSVMDQMGKSHPDEPHWYLPLIGVDPAAQNGGIGSALLRRALAEVDRAGVPAYLESTNPANLPLYQRHGFEVLKTIRVGDAPPVFPMLREPR